MNPCGILAINPTNLLQASCSSLQFFPFNIRPFLCFNPLTPKADQRVISPHNIISESNIRVIKIKEMTTN